MQLSLWANRFDLSMSSGNANISYSTINLDGWNDYILTNDIEKVLNIIFSPSSPTKVEKIIGNFFLTRDCIYSGWYQYQNTFTLQHNYYMQNKNCKVFVARQSRQSGSLASTISFYYKLDLWVLTWLLWELNSLSTLSIKNLFVSYFASLNFN